MSLKTTRTRGLVTNRMSARHLGAALVTVTMLIIAACGGDDTNGGTTTIAEELRALGLGDYLDLQPERTEQRGEWQESFYDPAQEQAICYAGAQYQANVRRGTTNNLLIYLEGGGACWSFDTCYGQPIAKSTANGAFASGIIDTEHPANPFRDWHMVYAPYCDGSVFAGDNILEYGGRRTFHHGIQNLSAAVGLALEAFPNPDLIVVSGSSAGGYGTFSGYSVTRVAYPDTPILVLNDSGPGLENPDTPDVNAQREMDWNFIQYVPADCTECPVQYTYLTDWALQRDPTLRVGYFSYLQDGVISFFLNVDGNTYDALLRDVTGTLRGRHPDRFKRFFVNGSGHTSLELPDFYTLSAEGVALRDWTSDFITNGPAWVDVVEP